MSASLTLITARVDSGSASRNETLGIHEAESHAAVGLAPKARKTLALERAGQPGQSDKGGKSDSIGASLHRALLRAVDSGRDAVRQVRALAAGLFHNASRPHPKAKSGWQRRARKSRNEMRGLPQYR